MSIIIPTCKKANLIKCLDSVLTYSSESVLVVANGFDDRDYLDSTGVPYIWFDEKIGYTKAINEGIRFTTDDVILLNDDVVVFPQPKNYWVDQLRQYDYSGSKMLVCDVTGISFLLFFCVFIKRTIFEKIGLPDEIFNPGFGEDIDFAWRVEAAGYKQHLVSTNIYHEGGNTVWNLPNWNSIVERNKKILANRYAKKQTPQVSEPPKSNIDRFDLIKPKLKDQDNYIYNEIFISKSYEIKPNDAKDNVVFDFGSNRGMLSIYAVSIGAREVVSVEANPTIYKDLLENIKDFPEIKPVNAAIFGVDGKTVKISNKGTASNISLEGDDVTTITMAKLLENYPNENNMILKLDCEGAEYDVVFSTPRELFRKFKYISAEIHTDFNLNPQYRGIDVFNKKMQEFGYSKIKDGQVYTWDVVIATGESVNWKPLPLWIQKWVRIDDVEEKPTETNRPVIKTSTIEIGEKSVVTAVINTMGRYNSTLPMTIQSIIYQTHVPKNVVIYDDNDSPVDMREIPVYKYLFQMLHDHGIEWYVQFGAKKGQHWNHQHSQSFLKQDIIWRIDDDEIAAPNVLEILLKNLSGDVGAVAGLVLMPNAAYRSDKGDNPITNVQDNCQWYQWTGKREAQHLYSSFIYRPGLVDYELSLSRAAHREETIFSHRLYRRGYKLIIDSNAVTTHLRNQEGGIRVQAAETFNNDDNIFKELRREWSGDLVVYLDNGVGDHVVFKTLLPDLHKKYKKVTIACCYPDLFEGESCISIEEGKAFVTPDRLSIYKWMADRNWKTSLLEAFKRMYLEN